MRTARRLGSGRSRFKVAAPPLFKVQSSMFNVRFEVGTASSAKLRRVIVSGLVALALFVLTAGPVSAQKLVIAWTAVSAFNSPFWIMNDAGFYKEEGLDVDTMYIPSSPDRGQGDAGGGCRDQRAKQSGDCRLRAPRQRSGGDRRDGKYRSVLRNGSAGDKDRRRSQRQNHRGYTLWRGDRFWHAPVSCQIWARSS